MKQTIITDTFINNFHARANQALQDDYYYEDIAEAYHKSTIGYRFISGKYGDRVTTAHICELDGHVFTLGIVEDEDSITAMTFINEGQVRSAYRNKGTLEDRKMCFFKRV